MTKLLPVTSRLLRDDSAVVSILVAGTMLMTIAMTGFSVDYGRAVFAKVELQSALDAGGLAGARAVNLTTSTMNTLQLMTAEANEYFYANWRAPFSSKLTGGGPSFVPNLTVSPANMVGSAALNVPTTMLWAIGETTMKVSVGNQVDLPTNGGIELAMVIDNTGSEAQGCKMNFLVAAAQGMINQLYGVSNPSVTNVIQAPSSGCGSGFEYKIPTYTPPTLPNGATTPPFFWTTLIPFVTSVAPLATSTAAGSDMQNWIKNGWVDGNHAGDFPANSTWGSIAGTTLPASYPAGGCVEARLFTSTADSTKDQYGGEDPVALTGTPAGTNAAWNGATFGYPLYGVELNPAQAAFTRYFYPSDNDSAPNPNNPNWTSGNADKPSFTTGGAPNAPYWPAFNVWSNSEVGAAQNFNDVTTGKSSNTTIVQSTLGNSSDELTVRSLNPTGDTVPVFLNGVPSNYTYVLGPNLGCPSAMTVFSTDYSKIMSDIAAMFPMMTGGTTTNIGLAWAFRALSPNWQGVWTEGSSSLTANQGQTLPLPYNTVITNGTTTNVAVKKVVIFLTDGNNQWGLVPPDNTAGGNTYTAYKTLDHTPLLDQTPAWTNSSNVKGGTIPAPVVNTSTMGTREVSATAPSTNSDGGAANSMTNEAWALCDAMKKDGITIYTILLEFETTDINMDIATGYQTHCATDPSTTFFELTGSDVSDLNNVFATIGNSLTELRLAQ